MGKPYFSDSEIDSNVCICIKMFPQLTGIDRLKTRDDFSIPCQIPEDKYS